MRKIRAFIWYQNLHFDGWIQKRLGHTHWKGYRDLTRGTWKKKKIEVKVFIFIQSLSSYKLASETIQPNSMPFQRNCVMIHRLFNLLFLIFSIGLIFSVSLTFSHKYLHHKVGTVSNKVILFWIPFFQTFLKTLWKISKFTKCLFSGIIPGTQN